MLIDSNILVYAINTDSPKNKIAQLFLQKNNNSLTISHQNIFETLRVLTHPKFSYPMKPEKAQHALEPIVDVCKIIYPDNNTLYVAFELIRQHNLVGNHIFDAYLAATAITNDITTIATDNTRDFKKFDMNVLNPFI